MQENSPPSKPVDISTIMPWITNKVTARQRKKNLQEWRENNPLTEDRPLPKIGMKNPALACYMISTLQQLFRLPTLKRFFEENTFAFPTDESDKLYKSRLTLYHAQSIFYFMKLAKGEYLDTSKSLEHLWGIGYRGRADDGQEVVVRIIGACNDLRFTGTTLQTQKTSTKIANGTPVSTETNPDDPRSTLEVELDATKPSMKLEYLLGKYFAEETIEDYIVMLPDSKKSFSELVNAHESGDKEIDDYLCIDKGSKRSFKTLLGVPK